MLAIGRSVFRARLHSSLPVTTSWTAADHAPTPAGPLLAEAAGAAGLAEAAGAAGLAEAAGAAGLAGAAPAAEAGASTLAARARPAIKPVTRAVSQPLVPMTLPLRSQQTTGASLSVTARRGKRPGSGALGPAPWARRPGSGADPGQVGSLQLIKD